MSLKNIGVSIGYYGSDDLVTINQFGYLVRIVRVQPIILLFLQLYNNYYRENFCERFTCCVLCYRQIVVKSNLIVCIVYT